MQRGRAANFMSEPTPNGQPQSAPIPSHWRRFEFKVNFQNVNDGKIAGCTGEVWAINYTSAMIKLLASLGDQPGRVLSLAFQDITGNRVITPTGRINPEP